MIIVERDLRDILCNEMRYGVASNADSTYEYGKHFAELQISLRENIPVSDSVMWVRFEDLILDYDRTVKKIEEFLKLDSRDHIEAGKYLKTEISIRNIGQWKDYYKEYREAINGVADMVPEYLCDFEE